MRRALAGSLLFLFFALFLFFFRTGQRQDPVPQASSLTPFFESRGDKSKIRAATSATPLPYPSVPAHELAISKPALIPTQRRDQRPEGNWVEIELVEHGWAVAYGDVLLGKIKDGVQVEKGQKLRTEAADPQTWERPEIPYLIRADLPNPSRVEKALAYLRQNTPVNFVPADAGQKDLIVFEQGEEHCYSYLGKVGGAQPIRLSAGCSWQEILHETLHALGFVHEQSRTDRSRYIEILWDNIDPKYQAQFSMVPESFMEAERDTPFDFHSVMLYEPTAFAAREGMPTLKALGDDAIAPVREGLSSGDIQRIKRLYRMD